MKNAVVFDMDGTLIDSMWMFDRVRKEVIEDMGYKLTKEQEAELEGVSFWQYPKFFNEVVKAEMDDSMFFHLVNTQIRINFRKGFELKKGLVRFLDYLDEQGVKYCVATASKNIDAISNFKALGMLKRFEFIITTNDVDRGKEYPTIYKEAAIMLGTHISNTYVFEDAPYAAKTAKAGGFKVVGIADDYFKSVEDEVRGVADYFIQDYDELMDMIERKEITFEAN
ncbi:MAG: HAD family phosphatase [Erysipelothrix sp.]|nr:HAD family phosphatase [Erysipelothrix sp.]